MKFNELSEQCQHCFNLQIFSLYMDGNHDYCCGKCSIRKAFTEQCPRFTEIIEEK